MFASLSHLVSPLVETNFRRLWVAQLLSEAGDWAARLALAAMVYISTDSALYSALTVAVSLLPALGPGQILTSWLDSFDRRRVLVGLDVLRALIFASLALSPPVWVILIMAAISGLLTAPFDAIQSSMSVEVPSAKRRDAALTLQQITQDISALVGYAAGGALLAFLNPNLALLVNAGSFLLSAALLSKLPLPKEDITESSPWRGIHDGFTVLRSHRGFWLMAILSVSSLTTGTVIESLVVSYYQEANTPNLAGVALPILGLVTIALLMVLSPQTRKPTIRNTALILVVSSLLFAALVLTSHPAVSVVAFAVAGAMFVPVALSAVLVKPLYPRDKRATTVSLLTGVRSALSAVVIFAVGAASDIFSTGRALAILGVLTALVAAWVLVKGWRDPFTADSPAQRVDA